MPTIILAGDEDFMLYRRLDTLRKSLLQDESWSAFNFIRIDKPSITDIIDNAGSIPFGAGNKLILFDRCDLFTKKKKGDSAAKESKSAAKSAKQLDLLEKSLESILDRTYLLFACPYNFDETLKISKIFKNKAEIERFPKIRYFAGSSNPTLETWVRKEAKRFAATIDDDAVSYLLDGTEADLRQISKELEKASTYILPAKHISYQVVVDLSPHHSHVFTMLEHWLEGNSKQTLQAINELLSRQPAMQVIATLQTFLGRWIEMKAICEAANARLPGMQNNAGKRELPLPELVKRVSTELKLKPFLVEKDLKRLRKRSISWLVEKRQQLTRLEQYVKSGQVKERTALELFFTCDPDNTEQTKRSMHVRK